MQRASGSVFDSALAASFLDPFPPDVLERLLADAAQVTYPVGATMHSDPGRLPSPSLMLDGLARLYLLSPDGRQVTVPAR